MSLMVHVLAQHASHRSATAHFCFHSVALELRCVLGQGSILDAEIHYLGSS